MPLLCWHYTPSLWPWSLRTLSRPVSMTTTQGRLLVTCVGGFACTEWELHNRLNRERVFGCAQLFKMRIIFMNCCNGTILEHVVEDGTAAVFFFIQTSISHIKTLHNCCGSLTTAPTLRFSAVPEAQSWSVRRATKKKEIPLPCPCPSDKGIMASSYRPQASCLSAWGRKSRLFL